MSAVEACSIEGIQPCDVRSGEIFTLVPAAQGDQLVALEREVQVDVQLHVLVMKRSSSKTEFCSGVRHPSQVGHQAVVGEGRDADFIFVEHVPREGRIDFRREDEPVVKEAGLHSEVP